MWLGAVAEDGAACAVLGGGVHEEMGFIDWIYTAPDYREKGAADSLLKTFSTLLNRIDAEAIEIGFSDTDDGLSEFLEEEQFLISEEGDFFSVPLEDLIYSEVIEGLEKGRDPSGQIVSANELVDPRPFFGYLRDRNIPCSVYLDELRENSLILLDDNNHCSGRKLKTEHNGCAVEYAEYGRDQKRNVRANRDDDRILPGKIAAGKHDGDHHQKRHIYGKKEYPALRRTE